MYTSFLFGTSEQELHYVLLQKKATESFPLHWHDEIEISFVLSGELSLILDGEDLAVKAGDVLFINSGDSHYFRPSDAEVITIIFSPDILSGTAGSDSIISGVRERLGRLSKTTEHWNAEAKEELISYIKELAELSKESFSYELMVRSIVFRIVAMITDETYNPISEKKTSVSEQSKVRDRIAAVFSYIEAHYKDSISLPDAAEASGYVPTYFSRVFKSCTGMTFYDYLTIFRIRKAEIALVSTSSSIQSIATEAGFSSVKTFDRVFKEQTGISPLKFRKMHTKR